MARVLDVLKRPGARHEWPAVAPRPFRPADEAVAATDPAESVPFIEIGGPCEPGATATEAPPPQEAVVPARLQVRFQPLPPAFMPPLPSRFAQDVVAFHQPAHRISEQYRRILCAITEQAQADTPQVLLFTSSSPHAGTTTVLLNLAVTYARQGIGQIALVDTHFGRPAIANRLGLAPAPGLQEVLAGLSCLDDAVRESAQPHLFALTAGTALHAETALLASETMRQLLQELRGRFQWVFVDAPCWSGRPEVIALGSVCDAVYLVAPQNHEGATAADDMLRLMPRHGTPLRGQIVTQQ